MSFEFLNGVPGRADDGGGGDVVAFSARSTHTTTRTRRIENVSFYISRVRNTHIRTTTQRQGRCGARSVRPFVECARAGSPRCSTAMRMTRSRRRAHTCLLHFRNYDFNTVTQYSLILYYHQCVVCFFLHSLLREWCVRVRYVSDAPSF